MTGNTAEQRPSIPAELARRIYVEAGHRCAIPTCRYITTEIHHIIPWATCKAHEYDNLIALCPNCHNRADRGEIDRKALRLYKLNLRFAHDKFSQLEMDVLFDLYHSSPRHRIPWIPFMLILLKRLTDAGYINVIAATSGFFVGEIKSSPDVIEITDTGRSFVEEMGLHELQ
ncbi:MAG: HNH endonuclease [Sphingopyxis sp.]|nr:HNH endonuclease [Sphingopyxis sp.]